MLATSLDEEKWEQISNALPVVLKQCPRPPDLPDAEGKLLPPSRQQQLADEAVLKDARRDRKQMEKRDNLTKILFHGNVEGEAYRLSMVVENCQQRLFKCQKDYFDVNPTFKFIMQHARQLFPQAHIAHWGADTKLWEQETNLIVQHLKATVELIRGLRPEKYVDDFETDSLQSDSGDEAKNSKEAQQDPEPEDEWAPPTEIDVDDLKEAHQRLMKRGFPIADPEVVFEQLVGKANANNGKEGRGNMSPKSGGSSPPRGNGSPSRGGMVRKRKVRKVIPLAVMANWCAHKGYPRLKEEEEEKVEERKTTFWDGALAVRGHADYLWNANNEQALVECMSADEPDVALVRQLLSKPKVSLDAKDDTFGLTPTHFAARLGNQQIGALLLDRNPEQVPDKMGNTPLHYAAKSGFNEMVKMLLPRRAAIDGKNKNGWTPLHWACATGHSDVATTLIAAKAAVAIQDLDGRTEAMWAAKHGHSEALAVLLDRGFDLNICDKFGMAVADHAQDHLELRMSLLEAEQRNQQLLQAAQRGSKDSAVEALEEGAYVDARDEQGWTALVWSMMGCCVDLVIVLAQHSADPNVLNECSEVLDHLQLQGDQVRHALEAALAGGLGAGERLLAAARNNNFQVVKVELEVGAQVNSQTREQLFTSLIFAAAHCNYQGAVMLLNRKANVGMSDLTGWSAIHYAVQSGSLDMVSMLSNAKANLVQTTFDGTSTMHLAARSGLGSMVQLLHAARVDLNAKNAKGVYAIQEAARWGCSEALQVMITYKADPRVKDAKGRSLLCIAVAAGRNDVVRALLQPLPDPVELVPKENEKTYVNNKGIATSDSKELLGKAIVMRRRFLQVKREKAERLKKKQEDALKAQKEAEERERLKAELEAAVKADEAKKKARQKAKASKEAWQAPAPPVEASPGPPPPPAATEPGDAPPAKEEPPSAAKGPMPLDIDAIQETHVEEEEAAEDEEALEESEERMETEAEILSDAAGGRGQFSTADIKGRLPVHAGAVSKRLDTMTLLLELRASVNAVDKEGNTPLILAARLDDRWMVEVVLKFGADPSIRNADNETCFSYSTPHMKEMIHHWVQTQKYTPDVVFPLPPSPLQQLYRVRVESIPMLMHLPELEEQVLQFFAKLPYDKPMRIIVPSEPIHGWPKGFCYADFSERQHAYEICKASKVDGIFMMRRRLNFINQGVHYQYKDPAADEAAKDEQTDP